MDIKIKEKAIVFNDFRPPVIIIRILFLVAITSLSAQESVIKDFAEERRELKLCFYPSTLRMLNLNNDSSFNQMVSDIDKLLIYELDSQTVASGRYKEWMDDCANSGFEKYISMRGARYLVVMGKKEELIGVLALNYNVIAFYLKGHVDLSKIPELIRTFESNSLLNMIVDQLNE